MSDLVGVVTVNVREKNGFYVASSKELLGLYIADTDKERVLADVPNVIRALLKEERGLDVQVVPGTFTPSEIQAGDDLSNTSSPRPWVAIPKINRPQWVPA